MLHVDDQLPFYVNGTLSPEERAQVQEHLASCVHCQQELLFWQSLSAVAVETRETLETEVSGRAPALPHLPAQPTYRRSPFRRAANLLTAQWRLIWWQAALASGVILLAGILTLPSVLSGFSVAAVEFLRWLAPLATALGVSLCYTPVEREMAELLETLPTSPRTVLLARLSILYGGNAAVIFLLALALGPAGLPIATLASGWLIPMALLSSLAFLIAVLADGIVATAVASGLWALLGFNKYLEQATWFYTVATQVSRPDIALPLIAVQLGVALWLVGRPSGARYRPV